MISLSHTNEFTLLTPFPKNPVSLCCFLQREGFSGSTGSGNRVFSDPNTSILKNAFEDPRQREWSILSVFGLSTTFQPFTRVFAVVSAWERSPEVCLLCYLDDCFFLVSLEREAKQTVQ